MVVLEFLPLLSEELWDMVVKFGLDDPDFWSSMHAIICVDGRVVFPIVIEGLEYALVPHFERGTILSGDTDLLETFMREQGYTRVDY